MLAKFVTALRLAQKILAAALHIVVTVLSVIQKNQEPSETLFAI